MIRFIALSGFLGAGKTTTMVAGGRLLEEQGRRVALITNDQGTSLVDTQLALTSAGPVGEVTGGCFCCRFEDLLEVSRALVDQGVDTIIAESVGSCTDLQATVIRPLQRYYGTEFSPAPLTTVVDPMRVSGGGVLLDDEGSDLSYLFRKQLEDADLLAVNKLDVTPTPVREHLLDQLARLAPGTPVIEYSAVTGAGLDLVVEEWTTGVRVGGHADVEVDYDRYAAAEAELAWLNRSVELQAAGRDFSPAQWASIVLERLSGAAADHGWVIGHAKIGIETEDGLTKAGLISAGSPATVDVVGPALAPSATASLNARVACVPAELDRALDDAVAAADIACGVLTTGLCGLPAFKPGYPTPVHRLAAAS